VLSERAGGNPRTPRYVRGRTGEVTHVYGVIDNPLDHAAAYPPLYTVSFGTGELFGRAGEDRVSVDLHEDWLEPVP
jgi:hypothetical protein